MAGSGGSSIQPAERDSAVVRKAAALHRESIVIDRHCDICRSVTAR